MGLTSILCSSDSLLNNSPARSKFEVHFKNRIMSMVINSDGTVNCASWSKFSLQFTSDTCIKICAAGCFNKMYPIFTLSIEKLRALMSRDVIRIQKPGSFI